MNYRIRTIEDTSITPADTASSIPLYHQIYMDLLSLIQTGDIKPGDMIPPEIELAKAYQVSRQTIRDAMERLENEKMIKRTAGLGTVVVEGKNRIQTFLVRSFAQQMIEMGYTSRTLVLLKDKRIVDSKSPKSLQERRGSESMVLHRLRYANDEPIVVQYSTVIIDRFPEIMNIDFSENSLYNVLMTQFKQPVDRLDQIVSSVIADDWQTKLLEIPKLSPLLVVNTIAYLSNGDPIEDSISFYRADRYQFSITHKY